MAGGLPRVCVRDGGRGDSHGDGGGICMVVAYGWPCVSAGLVIFGNKS